MGHGNEATEYIVLVIKYLTIFFYFQSSHAGLGVFGIVAEPSLNGRMKKQYSGHIGTTNPGFVMEEIEEEGSSIGSSLPGTPQLSGGSVTTAAGAITIHMGEKLTPNASPKSSLKNIISPVAHDQKHQEKSEKFVLNESPAASQEHLHIETSSSQENLMQNASPVAQENLRQEECSLAAAAAQEKPQRQAASAPPASSGKKVEQQTSAAHRVERKAAAVISIQVNQVLRKPRYNIQVLDLQDETTS